ncbi:hypothetical protein VIBNIFTn2_120055 [Vibrio nigripulchritudo FTn2]|uniref:hypothetical protein n=1 Tax=Vibrio nigripulchritudo TaxID=28173 RepID=UPI0003B224D6|nr:hypothetical protein [Vibrio nigripulchritudo]CCN40073.1 hypothetical protein VIBNIFTn2_120055 [Vibrio nigripulchritudo FTn2]
MFNVSIPKSVLNESHQVVKNSCSEDSIQEGSTKFNYLKSCDNALRNHLGVVDGVLAIDSSPQKILDDEFSLSLGLGQQLKLTDECHDLVPHLRMYSTIPNYVNFQVSQLPKEWHQIWGIAMARLLDSMYGFITNSITEVFRDEDLIKKATNQSNPISSNEFIDVLSEYQDDIEDEFYDQFIGFIEEYRPFLKGLFDKDLRSSWQNNVDNLDESDLEELDSILTRIEASTHKMKDANVTQLEIDYTRSPTTLITVLLSEREIENETIQDRWEDYNNDPLPVAIGLIPSPSSNIKGYLEAFIERIAQLENLIQFFNRLSEE